MRMNISISTRFGIIIGTIFLLFYLVLSIGVFLYLYERMKDEAKDRARIVISIMDGIGAYANDTLKPFLLAMMPELKENPHLFISEVLSTTRIRSLVLEKSGKEIIDFDFKRLSIRPRNDDNLLTDDYYSVYKLFNESRDLSQWEGELVIKGISHLVVARPIIVTRDCLRCHGSREVAPKGILARYGDHGGFDFKENELMGIEIVNISLNVFQQETMNILLNVVLIGLFLTLTLFLLIEGTFLKLVGLPLYKISRHFENIGLDKEFKELVNIQVNENDEIGQLVKSFNTMLANLRDIYTNLALNNKILETTINGISDPIALISLDKKIIATNEAYRDWINHNNPCVFITENSYINSECISKQKLNEAILNKKTVIFEHKTVNNKYYLIHFYPVIDNTGNVNQIVHYIQDLNNIKAIEEKIYQSEKMAAIGRLIAGIAHEINNPLSIIKCYTDILLKELQQNESYKDDLLIISKNIDICKKIIERLLYFTHNRNENYELKDINEIIEEIILLVKKQFTKENIEIVFNKSELPKINVHTNKLKQVFLNLLINSKDAIINNGMIKINTQYDNNKRQIIIEFSDNGIGIPEENLSKIFEPFFTTKDSTHGTGLGLFIALNIIKEHSGDIKVYSKPNQGTTFIITLPVME